MCIECGCEAGNTNDENEATLHVKADLCALKGVGASDVVFGLAEGLVSSFARTPEEAQTVLDIVHDVVVSKP